MVSFSLLRCREIEESSILTSPPNFSRALPAYDNSSNDDADLFTTSDVVDALSSYSGRLLFSMGCHAGLQIDDAEVSASGVSTPVDDWVKTFADAGALWVANTGYGYADTDTVAYSAKLMADLAGNLNRSLTIGEALSEAKQQYAADNALLSPYDLKALMESTFYGLPMYYLNKPNVAVPLPSGPPTETDPITGLTAAPVSLSLGQGTSTTPGQLGDGKRSTRKIRRSPAGRWEVTLWMSSAGGTGRRRRTPLTVSSPSTYRAVLLAASPRS